MPLLCALLLTACGSGDPAAPGAAPAGAGATGGVGAAWGALVERFIETEFELSPGHAVRAGRHAYDGRVPDFSPPALARGARRIEALRAEAREFDPAELSEEQRFEREYLIATADRFLFWGSELRWYAKNPLVYSRAISPSIYLTREYAPLAQRMRAIIALLGEVPGVIAHMKANLETPLPRTYVEVGVKVFSGLGPYLERDVPPLFAEVDDAVLQAQLARVTAPAVAALADAVAFLESQRQGAGENFALGGERFRRMLWTMERVDVPLDRLRQLGERDLERNRAALREACSQLLPGGSIPDCTRKIQQRKPADGPVAEARAQLGRLRQFLIDRDLVTIPGPEQARVDESPPYRRWNSAYIEIPGPFEKGLPSTYYISPPDPSWSEADQLAYIPGVSDLLFTSVHEVWPGHFLQFLHANRSPRMFGRLFVGYAFAEGWAHYAEELVWEAGLGDGDPEVHVGQLLNALLRDVRFLSAIGLHTGGMTVAASEQMFREQAFQDAGTARQQAARGTFDPAYLNYTLGKLVLRKLRDDWCASRGGRAAWKEFHDRVLGMGGPPIALVREVMLGARDGLL